LGLGIGLGLRTSLFGGGDSGGGGDGGSSWAVEETDWNAVHGGPIHGSGLSVPWNSHSRLARVVAASPVEPLTRTLSGSGAHSRLSAAAHSRALHTSCRMG